MKQLTVLLFLFMSVGLSAQRVYTVLTPTDSTFQLDTREQRDKNGSTVQTTAEMDTAQFLRYTFSQAWEAQGRLATTEVQDFIRMREANRTKRLVNQDMDTSYVDMTADLMFSRLSGIWRLRLDSLNERVELFTNNAGVIKLKTVEKKSSQIDPGNGINIRLNVLHESKWELKDLEGEDYYIYSEYGFEQSERDETLDSEADDDLPEPFRYLTIPGKGRKVVLNKLEHIEVLPE